MTRKKKRPSQSKRQKVTDSSGWTHIIKGPTNTPSPRRRMPPDQIQPSITLKEYTDKFHAKNIPHWKESSCFKKLTRILEEEILAAENVTISRCVCLGLGSLTAGTLASSYELATFMSVLETLSTHLSPEHPIQRHRSNNSLS